MKFSFALLFLFFVTALFPFRVREIDLLGEKGLRVNAAGPLLLCCDERHNRIFIVNTVSSSLSVYEPATGDVLNIPTGERVPPYLKNDSICLNSSDGSMLFCGEGAALFYDPSRKAVARFQLSFQPEAAACSEKHRLLFLAGRASRKLAVIDLEHAGISELEIFGSVEEIRNLNMTPPPPIRKIVVADSLESVFIIDGLGNELISMDLPKLAVRSRKALDLPAVKRWHRAGFDKERNLACFVLETAQRKVIMAVRLDLQSGSIEKIELRGLQEGVGYAYHSSREELYISYDNDPYVEVASFRNGSKTELITVAAYGNDALGLDALHDRLYVASWAYGEIDTIDLRSRKMINRFRQAGILPHMFAFAFHQPEGAVYFLKGATAVNGSFGAALHRFDPGTDSLRKILLGWPLADAEKSDKDIIAFSGEDELAVIDPLTLAVSDFRKIPAEFPHKAVRGFQTGNIYLSYGPHQSYWPVVYIWSSDNGILTIKPDYSFERRRLARLAPDFILTGSEGILALQNNWGDENQFLALLPDPYQEPNLGTGQVKMPVKMTNETRQRIVIHDQIGNQILTLMSGETSLDPGMLSVLDPSEMKELRTLEVCRNPIDLAADRDQIYVISISDNSMLIISRDGLARREVRLAPAPVKTALLEDNGVLVLSQRGNCLQSYRSGKMRTYRIPFEGLPDNIERIGPRNYLITSYTPQKALLISFDSGNGRFRLLHSFSYPYGRTAIDNSLNSFFNFGQFADNRLHLSKIKKVSDREFLVSDLLSAKILLVELNR